MKTFGGHKHIISKKSVKVIAILALFFTFMFLPTNSYALTEQERLNQISKQLQDAKRKLNQTTAEKKTLQGEIANFDRQIGDVQAQINSTRGQIARLNGDITTTNRNIKETEKKLAITREQLSEYLRVSYEDGQISTIELIAGSRNFSEFVNKTEYKTSIQLKVKDIADEAVNLKSELERHRKLQEQRKQQNLALEAQQAQNQQELAQQRSGKNQLLSITKGNEAEYQTLIKRLQREHAALEAAIWAKNNSGNFVSKGKVRAGDIIGYMGNSGFSTGCHLHFEIRTPSYSHVNPASYIGGNGYVHPVPGARVTAPYGYSAQYFPGIFHTGIDYAKSCGTPIRATTSGDIVAKVTGRPNTYAWSYEYGNYVKIRHYDGKFSLYAHLR